MNGTLKLKKPIPVNGSEVRELAYNNENITNALFCEADTRRRTACGLKATPPTAAELDYSLHVYIGYAAIIAENPTFAFADLERITGKDIVDVMHIGRNFILKSEDSQRSNSDEQSENIPDTSTQA